MSIETITPTDAKDYLNVNTNNRVIRNARVSLYADSMRQGEWLMTGEPIVFSSDGSLINGQHRLAACIEAEHPFTTVIVRGVSPEAYTYLDSGLPRSVSDVVGHAGIKNATTVTAAARLVIGYRAGVLHNTNATARTATRTAVKAEVEANDDIYQIGCNLSRPAARRGHIPSAVTAMHVLLETALPANPAVDQFMHGITTGAGLDEGDPRLTLANQFLGANRPTNNVEALALLIRAWNAWRKNEQRRIIKGWTRGTPYPIVDVS